MNNPQTMQTIPGFESTAYAYQGGAIVWVGDDAVTEHPRNARSPWQPPVMRCDPVGLQKGAALCLQQIAAQPTKGLLLWLTGRALPFPLNLATGRFDAIRAALQANDCAAFESAALRVIGLGHGLTPSGDDLVGGMLFTLLHAPRTPWLPVVPALHRHIRAAAQVSTNVISAALLDDLMQGASYGALHAMLAALQSQHPPSIAAAAAQLLRVGASSGADLLAGVLLVLTTQPQHEPSHLLH
jgi:Protein of unknown function (DUF2877)